MLRRKLRDQGVRFAKSLIASAAYYSGLLALHRRRVMRRRAVILVYHRVLEGDTGLPDYSPYGMSVSAETFAGHLAYLKKNYEVIGMSELVALLEGGKGLRDNLCVITFDDGWRDNYQVAFPLLKENDLPATIFLATNLIDGRQWFWEERIKYLLAHFFHVLERGLMPTQSLERIRDTLVSYGLQGLLEQNKQSLPPYLTDVVRKLSATNEEILSRTMESLEALLEDLDGGVTRDFLSWEDVREMSNWGIEFAAHSVTHQSLSGCEATRVAREVTDSRARVEEETGREVSSFAYPYGKFDDAAASAVRKTGIKAACTLIHGLNDSHTDPMRLRRIDIYQDVSEPIPVFACRILRCMSSR